MHQEPVGSDCRFLTIKLKTLYLKRVACLREVKKLTVLSSRNRKKNSHTKDPKEGGKIILKLIVKIFE